MKIIIIFISLFFSTSVFSQITLTASNNPVPGDIITQYECDTNGISEGNSGANQNWSFPNLIIKDTGSTNFVTPGSTPYFTFFPASNLSAFVIDTSGSPSGDTTYFYITSSSSGLVTNGFYGFGNALVYTDPITFYEYPFTYNSSFTDNYSYNDTSTGSIINSTGTLESVCDAWGTLVLPNGTFVNSIRIKSIQTQKDSSFQGIPFVEISTDTNYDWYIENTKLPVFSVSYSYSIFNGIPNPIFKYVYYSPDNPSIGITQLNTVVTDNFKLEQNYPNPFNPSTKIRFQIASKVNKPAGNVLLIVYDALGNEIETLVNENLQPGSYEVKWDAGGLSSGIYFYKLSATGGAGDFEQTRRMILIK